MLNRGARAWIALTALVTLAVPAVGSLAGPRDELEEINADLDALRAKIGKEEAVAGSLQTQIDRVNANILMIREKLGEIDADIAEVESQVRTEQARIDSLQSEIDEIEKVATRQAVNLYKSGATDTIDALLNVRSLTELDNRIEMLGMAAQENTGALIQRARLQVEIEAAHQALFDKKEALEREQARKLEAQKMADKEHDRLAVLLAKAHSVLKKLYKKESLKAAQSQAITYDILKKTTLASVAQLGRSSQGYIWPLAGNVTSYYGPRWGRMHTGIDIDGTTGEPVVASKAGTVILASSYSGYGNAVIIDHGGVQTLYAHLSSFNVSEGQEVPQGEIVGSVGCTGSCTGDHLHFEVRVNGEPVDPMSYLP
jgi:murein DD-endopeptidase MepM/ murein hydrolase activator NlpD